MTNRYQELAVHAEECGRASIARTEEAAWQYARAFFKSEIERYAYVAGWNLMAIHRNGGL